MDEHVEAFFSAFVVKIINHSQVLIKSKYLRMESSKCKNALSSSFIFLFFFKNTD